MRTFIGERDSHRNRENKLGSKHVVLSLVERSGKARSVRGNVHTNTIEGVFSDLQARHEGRLSALQREALASLLGRVDFRYNERDITDPSRTTVVLRGIAGKRLTYQHS